MQPTIYIENPLKDGAFIPEVESDHLEIRVCLCSLVVKIKNLPLNSGKNDISFYLMLYRKSISGKGRACYQQKS